MLPDFNEILNLLIDFYRISRIKYYVVRSVEAVLVHADRWTDGETEGRSSRQTDELTV
jgi:hypothetical protein